MYMYVVCTHYNYIDIISTEMCTYTCTFTCAFTCTYYVCNVLICTDYRDVHIYMYMCIYMHILCMYMYNGILYMYMYVQRCAYMYNGMYMYRDE